MTRPIDEKIVSMKMDNSDFKQKAAETTSLFGKLRDALNKIPGINLGQTTESLKDIGRETNNIDMNGLANNIQTVANRFTNLGIVATTALVNITNRAMNAGLALTKSLTVDPIMQGFDEYELKIGSIKTILSNTQWAGTSLDDVKRALGELNDYADQTIYSFSEMTSNIGRFTAAGVKLDDSTIAIKGLSNLAAASGSNVEQLNSAMYQMSQAMAAGKMNLMDWNSLVNAGMGGKKLQDSLLETAKAMGKQVDMTDGFRSSIEQGWLTSEVFLTTLKKFGNDQSMIEAATKVRTFSQLMDTLKESIGSGWATTFELIIGDFEEATNLWSKVAESLTKSVGQSADERNKLLESIADKGGFQNIFEGIENASKPVVQVFKAIGDGFEKAFPPASVDRIVQMTNSFKEFTAGLSLSDDRVQQLTTIFHGLFAIFSTVWEIAKRLTSAFVNLIPPSAGVGILSLLEKLAEMSISFNESVKAGNVLTKTIDGLGVILGGIGRVVGELTGYIFGFGLSLKTGIGGAVDWITKKIAPVGQNLKDAFGGFGGDEILGAGTLVGMGLVIQKIFGFFSNANRIVNSVKEVFEGIGDAVKNFAMGIQINNLLRIAIALGILAASLKVLEGIDAKDLANGITALATSLGVMIGGMTLINKLQVTGGIRASVTLIALATAVSIMAGALKKISDLNTGDLIRGMVGLVAVTASLSAAIIAISKLGGKINTGSIQLIALAGAVYILAGAVSKMSGIDTGGLLKSVFTLGVIFAELAAFIKMVNGAKLGMGSALGLIAVSGAITLIVGAIQKMGHIRCFQQDVKLIRHDKAGQIIIKGTQRLENIDVLVREEPGNGRIHPVSHDR
jgi:tape measure domain-containing protein